MDVTRFIESSLFLPAALLTALVVALLLVVGVVAFVSRDKTPKGLRVQKALFFSPTERALLGALDRTLGGNYRIFGKVRVADVLEPRPGPFRARTRRIFRGRVDYVVCRANDLSVLCVINVESQNVTAAHKRRRALTEAAFEAAELPLLWLPERQSYALQTVQALLAPVFAPPAARPLVAKRDAGPRTLEPHLN